MHERLLEILAEPRTHAPLRLEATRRSGDVVEEGWLISGASGKRYPIRNGIPRFVELQEDYATSSFGRQWNAHGEVQLDSATGTSYSRKRFENEAGWSEEELRGTWLLDAGCGAGRFAEVAAALKANVVAPWTKLYAKYLVRPDKLHRMIERTMPVLFPLTDFLFRIPLLGKVARFAIPVANYTDRADMTREQRYAEAILDTFDMLAPRYDSPMTGAEMERALREAGASRWDLRTRVPVNVVGVR